MRKRPEGISNDRKKKNSDGGGESVEFPGIFLTLARDYPLVSKHLSLLFRIGNSRFFSLFALIRRYTHPFHPKVQKWLFFHFRNFQ